MFICFGLLAGSPRDDVTFLIGNFLFGKEAFRLFWLRLPDSPIVPIIVNPRGLKIYLACTAALPVIQARRGLSISLVVMAITAMAMATGLLLVAQSEVQAWLGLAVAVAIGFAVKLVAAQSIKPRFVETE